MKFPKTVHHEYKPTGCMKPCAGLHCHNFLKIQTQAGPYLLPAFWNNGYTQSGLNFQLGYYEVLKYGYEYKYKEILTVLAVDIQINILDFQQKKKYLSIYFDTPIFDRQGRVEKIVDMLSAIGGTMGPLTGFSIISGVEILYYIFTISKSVLQNKKIENK